MRKKKACITILLQFYGVEKIHKVFFAQIKAYIHKHTWINFKLYTLKVHQNEILLYEVKTTKARSVRNIINY